MKYDTSGFARLKEALSRINWRLVLQTLLWFLFLFLTYQVCNRYQLTIHLYLYPILAGALILVYFILNGFSMSKTMPTLTDLPDSWEQSRKTAYLEKLKKQRKIAKPFLPPLFALILTLMIDLIILNLDAFGL